MKDFQFNNGGLQALENVLLFSVPLHPMLILWNHILCLWDSQTSGMQYISTLPSHVCCAFMYNVTLCKIIYIIILPNSDTNIYVITT